MSDLVRPRVFAVPSSPDSLGEQAVAFCRRVELGLDPEQELVLAASMGVREDGRWQSPEVGVNAPRQNGKGEILMARELFGAYELGEMSIVHSSHEFKTSERHFARMERAIRRSPELLGQVKRREGTGRLIGFRYGRGDEAIELQSGAMVEFKTRTRSGLRGFDDVALLVLDEAMILSAEAHSAMLPTVRASRAPRGPQIWYAGSAADQMVHENSVIWARVRERGIAGDDSRLTYAEWSLDFDHPDDVPELVLADPEMWALVNWAIVRGRVSADWMEGERRSMLQRGFIVELLNVGDWPATDSSVDLMITGEQWESAEDGESVLEDPICIAFDVSPDRRTAIVAAGGNGVGKMHVEVVNARAGTGWVAERLEQLYLDHEVVEIVCDGLSPSVAVARRVEELGVPVRRVNSPQYAEACGVFVDQVAEQLVAHIGQDELAAAVRGARVRPLVDRWAWSRTKSVGDVGALIGASLAVWSAVDVGILNREFAIY